LLTRPDLVTLGPVVLWSDRLIASEVGTTPSVVHQLLALLNERVGETIVVPLDVDGLEWLPTSTGNLSCSPTPTQTPLKYYNAHAVIKLFHRATDPSTPFEDLQSVSEFFKDFRRKALLATLKELFWEVKVRSRGGQRKSLPLSMDRNPPPPSLSRHSPLNPS
jgi:hypothetical protein